MRGFDPLYRWTRYPKGIDRLQESHAYRDINKPVNQEAKAVKDKLDDIMYRSELENIEKEIWE